MVGGRASHRGFVPPGGRPLMGRAPLRALAYGSGSGPPVARHHDPVPHPDHQGNHPMPTTTIQTTPAGIELATYDTEHHGARVLIGARIYDDPPRLRPRRRQRRHPLPRAGRY